MTVLTKWVNNSKTINFDDVRVLYAGIILSLIVQLHSYWIHKLSISQMRLLNDVAAFSLLGQSICFLVCAKYSVSLTTEIILENLIANALFSALIQIVDNYLTFSRYVVVCGGTKYISKWHRTITLTYIIITMYCTWVPYFTIFPFFYDMKSHGWKVAFNWTNKYVGLVSYLLFDIVYFGLVFNVMNSLSVPDYLRIKILGYKALLHTVFSMAGQFADGILLAIHAIFILK